MHGSRRSCPRCRRHERSRALAAEAPAVVREAVRLILDGALDRDCETGLAARLGVSNRHLRRLFGGHLGLTPTALARAARADVARRLLDETDLSITDVAFAAGFQSLRQFNRVVRETFDESPRSLRSRRRRLEPTALRLRLPDAGAVDWASVFDHLAAVAIPGVESAADGVYRRTIAVDGGHGMIEIADGGRGSMLLAVHLTHWDELVRIVERARRIIGLRADVEAETAWDAFETGVRILLVDGRAPADAGDLRARFAEGAGIPVTGLARHGLTRGFPSPEQLARCDLVGAGIPEDVAGVLSWFARAVDDLRIRPDGAVRLCELVHVLTTVVGVPHAADTGGRRALAILQRRLAVGDAARAAA